MKALLKKTLSLTIAACMIFLAVPTDVFAASSKIPITNLSDSYKNSKYYTRANEAYTKYKNSSDAERFVRIALSQKGYKGSKKSAKTYSGNPGEKNRGKYTEYSRYMKVAGQDWCASFVSWSARAAGISENVIVSSAGCGKFRKTSKNGGKFIKIWSEDFKTYKNYKPKVGDIALYTPTCADCGKHRTSFEKTAHVVIVCDVADKQNADGSWTFTTIERSKNNIVGSNTLTTKSTRGNGSCTCKLQVESGITDVPVVQGFFHPNWADGKSAPNHLTNTASNNNKTNTNSNKNTTTNTNTNTNTNSNKNTSSSTSAATTAPAVTVTKPTDSAYANKFSVSTNNAVVVAKITKPKGSKVNYVGVVIYDNNWNLVSDKTFSITNVSNSSTYFHAWYDIKSELGVTLKPSSTYKYRIYTNIDNAKYASPYWTFTTKADTSSSSSSSSSSNSSSSSASSSSSSSSAATTAPAVTVTKPTDSAYANKFSVSSNNAVVVAKITKPSGSKVNYVGVVMYKNGDWNNCVCDKTFKVTNVSNSSTYFHTWFDIQDELGITLDPNTTYKYKIYTNIDGTKYGSDYWSLTTSK